MRKLSPGDIAGKLARIEHVARPRRWKRRARRHLLRDVKATVVADTENLDTPVGRICAKRRYSTFSAAFQGLISTWHVDAPWRNEQRVYPCQHCGGWHLTSKDHEVRRDDDPEE